ncbi:MAG: hypothetical protein FVQ77_06745 [Cytophagales bacterium]|nr:hypothetical protein [Cytophagales bacterium]
MRNLTLNIKNASDYQLLLQLAKRLGLDISVTAEKKEKVQTKQMRNLYKLLDSVKKNELFKEIKDPVKWQKELRDEWR